MFIQRLTPRRSSRLIADGHVRGGVASQHATKCFLISISRVTVASGVDREALQGLVSGEDRVDELLIPETV